jgi:hypothetical protein
MKSRNKGKLSTIEVLLTKAFTDQTKDIGWLPFLQGKISRYWREAYLQTLPKNAPRNHTAAQWGKKLILALWSFGKHIWEHRNREVHGHSIQETRQKTRAKLKKEIEYFFTKFQEDKFLVQQQQRHLFDSTIDQLTTSTSDTQAAWLRSVKEAVLVQKRYAESMAATQRVKFREFFMVKKTTSQPTPPISTQTKSLATSLRKKGRTRLPTHHKVQLTGSLPEQDPISTHLDQVNRRRTNNKYPQLTKVKGCKRLYKFKYVAPQTRLHIMSPPLVSSIPSRPSDTRHQSKSIRHVLNLKATHSKCISSSQSDEDSLPKGSGLSVIIPIAKRKSRPTSASVGPAHQRMKQSRQRTPTIWRKTEPIPNQRTLRDFGFLPEGPKRGNMVEISSREAEAVLTDYSGTYVSTVP